MRGRGWAGHYQEVRSLDETVEYKQCPILENRVEHTHEVRITVKYLFLDKTS